MATARAGNHRHIASEASTFTVPEAHAGGGAVEHRLPGDPASIGRGRRLAREVAAGLLEDDRAADLELVVSELLTNAVRHGASAEIVMRMTPKERFLCVQVTDRGRGFVPEPRAMLSDDGGGFGLYLVERLTRRWGMTREAGRTRVWFELDYAG